MKKISGCKAKFAGVLLLGCAVAVPSAVFAQDHVVAPAQIQKDVSGASTVRRQNEKELKSFLSREEIQRAMKSEGVNPQLVTNAVSQLNDTDLSRLAAQAQKAQKDYAAGAFGLGIFTLIGIVVVAVILIAVFA